MKEKNKRAVVVLFVLVFPVITNTFDDAKPPVGSSFKQTCEVTGSPLLSVIWSKDGSYKIPSNYLRDNNRTLLIEKLKVQDSGSYNCTVTNSVGATWKSVRLTVTDQNVKQLTSNNGTRCSWLARSIVTHSKDFKAFSDCLGKYISNKIKLS